MKWEEFLRIARKCPIITSDNLLSGVVNSASIEVQLSRWKKAGKVIQLKRGVYLLREPYRSVNVYDPAIAAVLKRPSYISLEKAFEYHNLIPEAVPIFTSVTPKRQGKFISEAGVFEYRHIDKSLFWGYGAVTVNKQTAFMATPEKALCDFFYLKKVKISIEYLYELRLQNLEILDFDTLFTFARRFEKPKMVHVADTIKKYSMSSTRGEKVL